MNPFQAFNQQNHRHYQQVQPWYPSAPAAVQHYDHPPFNSSPNLVGHSTSFNQGNLPLPNHIKAENQATDVSYGISNEQQRGGIMQSPVLPKPQSEYPIPHANGEIKYVSLF